MAKTYKLFGGLIVLALAVSLLVRYARTHPIAVLVPKGVIASQERSLIITATLLMLLVVVPVFILTFTIAWRYRASNTRAKHTPDWDHNRWLEGLWWALPGAIILTLAVITWHASYSLDPFKPISSSTPPLTIDVVALQWKWLFIYPKQHVASVNFAQIPAQTPIVFDITADAPMNSFWVPQLGGQIYAMPGMSTQLNLMASSPGSYYGSSANISGAGFASMDFTISAGSHLDFENWVNNVKQSPQVLTLAAYNQLARPSVPSSPSYYSATESDLYASTVMKYMEPQRATP